MSSKEIIIVGFYEIAEGDIQAFRDAALETARAARMIDGCYHYSFSVDLENPGLFHLNEIWRDQDTLDNRLTSDAFYKTREIVSKLSVLGRSVTHYTGAAAKQL